MDTAVSEESNPLLLNFHSHCLLCLQHVDPTLLHQIVNENPRGLHDFQPILSYLTGNPSELRGNGENTQKMYYPLTQNLPPLCKVCYDILAELYLFHCELLELQRKMQNQTDAARRIIKGTMRKRGGMRGEFFNRLKIAGMPKEDVGAMEVFIGNFHELIVEADQKAVFPQVAPQELTFGDAIRSTSSSSPCQSPSTIIQPYYVKFVEPMASSTSSASPTISAPHVTYSALPVEVVQPEEIDRISNEEIDLVSPPQSPSINHAHNHDLAEEYEKNEMVRLYEKLDNEAEDEDEVMILEDKMQDKRDKQPAEVIPVFVEEDYESDELLEMAEEENEEGSFNEELDLEHLKSRLPSSLIIEQVDEEEDKQMVEVNVEATERNYGNDGEGKQNRKRPSTPIVLPQKPISLSVRTVRSPPTTALTGPSERSHQCGQCHKKFSSARRLNNHEQEHLPENRPKSFFCPQCQKEFSNTMALEQHERIHTGERPCVCDICGERFRLASTLSRHKKAHERQQQPIRKTSRIRTPKVRVSL